MAFRADVPCFPRKQRLALPGPLALVLRTQDAGICGGCVLSESCWKLSTRTPCRRQSRGPPSEIHELSGKGWGLPLLISCSTAQAVSAPVTLPVPWSSLRRMGSHLASPDGLCGPRMQHPGGSVAGRSDPWVVGPDWSPVPVPPLLGDLLASSALNINSSCLLVFVKVGE